MAADVGPRARVIHSINITPMVDIILVLLVIFMVTSSALSATQSIDIDKPNAATARPDEERGASLIVTCDAAGDYYVDDAAMEGTDLVAHATQAVAKDPQVQAIVRCDGAARVDTVVRLIDMLRMAGINKYAIATDPIEPQGE